MAVAKSDNANQSIAIATNKETIAGIKNAIVKIESAPAYNTDEIAQGACVAMSSAGGWVYAVRKDCPGQWNCAQICGMTSLKNQDPQVRPHRYCVACVSTK